MMLDYYRKQSALSDPGSFIYLYEELTGPDVSKLVKIIQDLVIHRFWIIEEYYHISLKDFMSNHRDIDEEINIRPVEDILSRLISLEKKPLKETRDPIKRKVGFCRDHALLLTSMLRYYNIPARVRSGAAVYFNPDSLHFEDHYVCEYWNGHNWCYADAQLDVVQRSDLGITFNTANLPRDQFFNAGELYLILKKGEHPSDIFGVPGWTGATFVRNKLVMDLACINKVEVLCWEGWGTCTEPEEKLQPSDDKMFESIANLLTNNDEASFEKMRELFIHDSNFKIPEGYTPRQMKFPVN